MTQFRWRNWNLNSLDRQNPTAQFLGVSDEDKNLKKAQEVMEEYDKLHNIPVDITSSVTHDEFVSGTQSGSISFFCTTGEPIQLVKGARKSVFNFLAFLYMAAPLILVPAFAYHEGNWWLLFGVAVSWIASFSAANRLKLIFLFLCLCIGVWFKLGFSIHQYITFFFFCAIWGHLFFEFAEAAQRKYARQSLVENSEFFDEAIAQNRIKVFKKRS